MQPHDAAGAIQQAERVVVVHHSTYANLSVVLTCSCTDWHPAGGRTARLVNPVAWEKGVVFGQCGTCEVWHVLSANNKKVFEEVRYNEDPEWKDK